LRLGFVLLMSDLHMSPSLDCKILKGSYFSFFVCLVFLVVVLEFELKVSHLLRQAQAFYLLSHSAS
jgi:hypothetical protein